jgi:glucose/arabinose dehydrogenase
MRRLLPLILLLAACKPDHAARPRDSAPARPPTTAPDPHDPPAVPGTAKPDPELRDVPAEARAVKLEKVVEGMNRPVLLTFAPGDPRKRLFVLEQHVGRVRVIEGGTLQKDVFVDLKGKVSTGNEQGLLGLAFAPDFADSHRVYVSYTDRGGDTRIVEYTTAAADSDKVDASTRREIFTVEQPYSNHNGGHLQFGPDGKLYLGLGDGGSAGDPKRNGQNGKSVLAKMLRFDVGAAEPEAEIVAMGVRNPWRFDFDPANGDVYIGDVGQDAWENVYAVGAGTLDGRNFGWNVTEGRHCYDDADCDPSKFTAPVADYPHEQGCSVTGGVVYRGKALPALDGAYFYGDFCIGWIRSFRWAEDGIRDHWDWRPVIDPDLQLTQLASFGRDEDGEIYVLSLDGTIWRLVAS